MRTRNATLYCVAALVAASMGRPAPARACTAFSVPTPEGQLLAKGFDWVTGDGWIVVNERSRTRSLLFPGDSSASNSWTSRYASLSATTVGPGFPVSGLNEAGLAIEALVDFSGARASTPEPGQLTGLEFIQYGLDRFGSVAELVDFAQLARVSQMAVALHFLACDRTGACAVIEIRRSGTRVTRDLPIRALANQPYAEDLGATRPSRFAAWLGWGRPPPGSSGDRFRRVARALESGPPRTESTALDLLETVVMPHRTQWQIVWNLERRTMVLRQREARLGTIALRLDDLDGRCTDAPRARALGRTAGDSFASWSEHDVTLAEEAVAHQVGGPDTAARRLAALVAAATRSSKCQSAQ